MLGRLAGGLLCLAVAAAALAGCGDLPQPFRGAPGAMARRLSQPPAARLAVTSPPASLLPDSAADGWANAVADALQAEEIPAVPGRAARRGDWRLALSAEIRGDAVVPSYEVLDPSGAGKGVTEGPPVPVRAWAEAEPATLRQAAAAATPGITSLLARIEAARQQADPNSLLNRPARLLLVGVKGAPGDGDRSLSAQMSAKLSALGLIVQDTPRGADFSVSGEVRTEPGANGTVRVEVQWIVRDPEEKERGRILQLNEVPPATIARYWGDVAVAVAGEAAGGVRDVVLNQAGAAARRAADATAATAAAGGAAGGAAAGGATAGAAAAGSAGRPAAR